MRNISAQAITDTVARLCIEANTRLPQDVQAALDKARQEEPWPLAKNTLDLLWSNLSAAREKDLPICQDTGMACVFVELGTDVHIDGSFEAASHEGRAPRHTDGTCARASWPTRCAGATPATHPAPSPFIWWTATAAPSPWPPRALAART